MSISQQVDNVISRFDLPILTLETRRVLRGRNHFRSSFIIIATCSALSIPLLLLKIAQLKSIIPSGDLVIGLGMLLYGVIMVSMLYVFQGIIIPLSARSIAFERESGSFYGLALTPMSSFSIVAQKISIFAIESVLLVIITLPACAILSFAMSDLMLPEESFSLWRMLHHAALPVIASLGASAGVLGSSLCRNSNSANSVAGILTILAISSSIWLARKLTASQWTFIDWITWWRLKSLGEFAVFETLIITFTALFTWLAVLRLEHLRRAQ